MVAPPRSGPPGKRKPVGKKKKKHSQRNGTALETKGKRVGTRLNATPVQQLAIALARQRGGLRPFLVVRRRGKNRIFRFTAFAPSRYQTPLRHFDRRAHPDGGAQLAVRVLRLRVALHRPNNTRDSTAAERADEHSYQPYGRGLVRHQRALSATSMHHRDSWGAVTFRASGSTIRTLVLFLYKTPSALKPSARFTPLVVQTQQHWVAGYHYRVPPPRCAPKDALQTR